MRAPPGALVSIYYDGEPLAPGDYLRTPTGRAYLVAVARVQRRGLHVGRQHLRCLVSSSIPAGARTLPLFWYPRG